MPLTKTEIFTIGSLVTPYVFALFFFTHTSGFTYLGLLALSAIFILGCLIVLLLTKGTRFKRIYYFLAAAIVLKGFIKFNNALILASDTIFFSMHKAEMTNIVFQIKKANQEKIKIEIPQVNFAAVDTLESGEVIFTLDGMLDNCVGIAYVEDNINPGYTNCGRIIEWRKLDDHWYFWYTT